MYHILLVKYQMKSSPSNFLVGVKGPTVFGFSLFGGGVLFTVLEGDTEAVAFLGSLRLGPLDLPLLG